MRYCSTEGTNNIADIHANGESPWPDISPECDTQMLKAMQEGTLNFKRGKAIQSSGDKIGDEKPIHPADRMFCNLQELRDTRNLPMMQEKRFLLCEADTTDIRALDRKGNKRQVAFNLSRSDGLHLVLNDKFWGNAVGVFGMRHPGQDQGQGHWLLGMLEGTNDIILGKTQVSSAWGFVASGNDKYGHPCYEIWSLRSDADGSGGIWFPENWISRAGYDDNNEWKTYDFGRGAPRGFFRVKFEMVE
ncbi:hypothetical protein TruAng_003326 [Truncatella angustata]|nr:hypothetical protein TruAng_003326 [Truncatella angustata]